LAWDNWSPGGPFLWAWVEQQNDEGTSIEAIRLDPHTCTPAGEGFTAINFSNDSLFSDLPEAAVITNQVEDNKVSLIGIQSAGLVNPTDTVEGTDFVVFYDLDVTPPPDWIGLSEYAYGTVPASDSSQFIVNLNAIMDDTVMTASIRIANNDILQPELVIPVNFAMTSLVTTNVSDYAVQTEVLGNNFPNPFSDITYIPVRLKKFDNVELNVYNLSGKLIANVASGLMAPGEHLIPVSAHGNPPGIYFYSLKTSEGIFTRKLVIKN
jgi:hypothetical protein